MINLIQNTPALILKAHGDFKHHAGVLTTPRSRYNIQKVVNLGMKWAMDNGCFIRYEPSEIVKMMRDNQGIAGCLFMVAPDVVKNHDATLTLFWQWESIIASYGYPVAFVLQDGVSLESVPFEYIDAVFIGGSTDFKYSETVRIIVKEAKKRGLWVHNGRVNTIKRIRYTKALDCDSFDGTCYSRFLKTYVKKHLPYYAEKQHNFFEELGI